MEESILQQSVDSASVQLDSLRASLSSVNQEIHEIEGFLEGRQQQEQASQSLVGGKEQGQKGSEKRHSGERPDVNNDGSKASLLDDLNDEERRQVLRLLTTCITNLQADGGDSLGITRALDGLIRNKPRSSGNGFVGKSSGHPTGRHQFDLGSTALLNNSHPHRLTVFSGSNTDNQCTFNVDHTTTFLLAHQFVCRYWEVDESEFCLQACHSVECGDYEPFVYHGNDLLVEKLEALKYDTTKGCGVNGVTNSIFITSPERLPPLYLVSSVVAMQDPAAQSIKKTSSIVGQRPEQNLQKLRRLYLSKPCTFPHEARGSLSPPGQPQDSSKKASSKKADGATKEEGNNFGYLQFAQFVTLVNEYFEGFYCDRTTLNILFQERSHVIRTSASGGSDEASLSKPSFKAVISYSDCIALVGQLSHAKARRTENDINSDEMDAQDQNEAKSSKGDSLFTADDDQWKSDGQASFGNMGTLDANRVFNWARAVGVFETSNSSHSLASPSDVGSRVGDEDLLTFFQFKVAIQSVVPVESDVVQYWWGFVSLSEPKRDETSRSHFCAGWPKLEKSPSMPSVNDSFGQSDMGALQKDGEQDVVTVGVAVKRAVLRFERDNGTSVSRGWGREINQLGSKPKSGSKSARIRGRICEGAAAFVLNFLALAIAYAALFSYYWPQDFAASQRGFHKELVEAPMLCYNLSSIIAYNESAGQVSQIEGRLTFFDAIYNTGCAMGFLLGPVRAFYYSQYIAIASAADRGEDMPMSAVSYSNFSPVYVTLRQLRSKVSTCEETMPKDSWFYAKGCLQKYDTDMVDKRPIPMAPLENPLFGNVSQSYYAPAFEWTDNERSIGIDPVKGRLATYDKGGYEFKLGDIFNDFGQDALQGNAGNVTSTLQVSSQKFMTDLGNLIKLNWLQADISALLINIGTMNPNLKTYTSIQFLLESSPQGNFFPSYSFNTFHADPESNTLILVLYLICLLFAFLALCLEVRAKINHAMKQEAVEVSAQHVNGEIQVAEGTTNIFGTRESILDKLSRVTYVVALSPGLILSIVILIWTLLMIPLVSILSNIEAMQYFAASAPNELWNMETYFAAYIRVPLCGSILIVLLSIKLGSVFKHVPGISIWARVAKAASLEVGIIAMLLLMSICCWLVSSDFIYPKALNSRHVGTSEASLWGSLANFAVATTFGSGMQTFMEYLKSFYNQRFVVVICIWRAIYNFYAVMLLSSLVIAVYYFYFEFGNHSIFASVENSQNQEEALKQQTAPARAATAPTVASSSIEMKSFTISSTNERAKE